MDNLKLNDEQKPALKQANVRRSFSSYMIEMHNFFLKTSPSYMAGTPKLKYLLQFPRAYCRFMYFTYMDWRRWRNCA